MTANEEIERLLGQANWQKERRKLRSVLLESGLGESVKWGKLCYSLGEAKIAIIYGMKDCCAIGFFKGALLEGEEPDLESPGKNSQAMRQLRFRSLDEIEAQEAKIRSVISKAIAVERDGREVDFDAKHSLDLPDELQAAFDAAPDFAVAFDKLTPGRKRGYILHFTAAKQPKTRAARVDEARQRVIEGKGRNDR